jgi:hypothetical protein
VELDELREGVDLAGDVTLQPDGVTGAVDAGTQRGVRAVLDELVVDKIGQPDAAAVREGTVRGNGQLQRLSVAIVVVRTRSPCGPSGGPTMARSIWTPNGWQPGRPSPGVTLTTGRHR